MSSVRACIYLRISLDRYGDGLAIDRQREDCLKIISDRGWELVCEYADESISATDRRKKRPQYDAMIADYKRGMFEAIVCWDLDRLTRQPKQLEDLIEMAEDKGLIVVTANGEADLRTDAGRMFARIKAAVARSEVERKGARQARKNKQLADAGGFTSGLAPYGYTKDAEIIGEQAIVVKAIYDAFLRGSSLKAIAAALSGERQVTGLSKTDSPYYIKIKERNKKRVDNHQKPHKLPDNHWTINSVRNILLNPRYCGFVTYGREGASYNPVIHRGDDGMPVIGNWQPIVHPDAWAAVQEIMSNPKRRTTREGMERKHLGTGLYVCGVCYKKMQAAKGRYICGNHLVRNQAKVDDYVCSVVRNELISLSENKNKRPIGDSVRERELQALIDDAREKIARAERDYDAGVIEGADLKRIRDKARDTLDEAGAELAYLVKGNAVTPLLFAIDPVKEFDTADLGTKRSIIMALIEVTIMPCGKKNGRVFKPDYIQIKRVADGSMIEAS